MLAELGVWRPAMLSAGGLRARGFLGAMVRRDSRSGERVGVRFFFSRAAFFAERTLRLRGSTAPVVGVTRGARPFLGRVDAWRCFLPRRFLSSRCAMGVPS